MLTKSVLVRPQGLRPKARAPTCPPPPPPPGPRLPASLTFPVLGEPPRTQNKIRGLRGEFHSHRKLGSMGAGG